MARPRANALQSIVGLSERIVGGLSTRLRANAPRQARLRAKEQISDKEEQGAASRCTGELVQLSRHG